MDNYTWHYINYTGEKKRLVNWKEGERKENNALIGSESTTLYIKNSVKQKHLLIDC